MRTNDDGTLPTLQVMRDHVTALAADYSITLCPDEHALTQSAANPKTRTAHLPTIKGPISYIIALHELGHLAHPFGAALSQYASWFAKHGMLQPADHDIKILDELFAYEWAFKRAKCWTPSMARAYRYGMQTHEQHRLFDAKQHDQMLVALHKLTGRRYGSMEDGFQDIKDRLFDLFDPEVLRGLDAAA